MSTTYESVTNFKVRKEGCVRSRENFLGGETYKNFLSSAEMPHILKILHSPHHIHNFMNMKKKFATICMLLVCCCFLFSAFYRLFMSFFGETQGSQKLTNPLRPSRAKKKEPFQCELVKSKGNTWTS